MFKKMNKKGWVLWFAILIFILALIFLGKPLTIWIIEKITNSTIMPDIRGNVTK